MPIPTNPILSSRLVDITPDGLKVFGYGRANGCLAFGDRVNARLIDFYGDTAQKVFGFSSECCEYPAGYEPEFVLKDVWPPSPDINFYEPGGVGISKLLKLRVIATDSCAKYHCSEATAEYDGAKWSFVFGDITLDMTVQTDVNGQSFIDFDVTGAGDCTVSLVNQPAVVCNVPLNVTQQLSPESSTCCDCCPNTTASMVVEVIGYCKRVKQARLIDMTPDGIKVFGYGEICDEFVCPDLDCCGDFNCTLQAIITDNGGTCGCLAGTYDLLPQVVAGQQVWQSAAPVSVCGCPTSFALRCLGDDVFEWSVATGGRNCSALTEFSYPTPCTQDFDMEFEFTLECPTCDPSPPAPFAPCCDCGSYSYTVTVVRKQPCS